MNNKSNLVTSLTHNFIVGETPLQDIVTAICSDTDTTFSLKGSSTIFSSDESFLYMVDSEDKDINLANESLEFANEVLKVLKGFAELELVLELSDSFNDNTYTIKEVEFFASPSVYTPPNQEEKYYVVTTNIQIGESTNNIIHLIKSCEYNLTHSAAEVAQSINLGRLDEDTYGLSCFDRDGFIAWPDCNKEITKAEFDTLSQWLDVYPVFNNIKDHSDCIKLFVL